MTHLWQKQLKMDAEVMFTISMGAPFWPKNMHEPLIVSIVFPLAYGVQNYRGLWSLRFSPSTKGLVRELGAGFKNPALNGSQKFHDLEGTLPDLLQSEEGWSGALLCKFLDSQRAFLPVYECVVQGMLPGR